MKSKLMFLLLVSLLFTACSGGTANTPIPTVVLNGPSATNTGGNTTNGSTVGLVIAASGTVVAEKSAQMAFTVGGFLKTLNVAAGDQVKAGQVLAELDNTSIQIALAQAQRTLKEMTSAASQAAAEQDLANARQAQKDAQDKVDSQSYQRATDTLIANTQGQIDLAKQELARASDAYRLVARLENGDSRKAAALVAMTNAQLRLNTLIANYNWYVGTPSDIDAAKAIANLDAAKAAVQEDQWYVSALKGEQLPPEATGRNLASLRAAQDAVATTQDSLDKTRIVAPINGTVVSVNAIAGETVSPGITLISISDVSHLHVETTDLSERNVPLVKVGQAVSINIKALNQSIPGKVTRISPVADTIGGDVVYKTEIEFDTPPQDVLAGMSVDVQYQTGQ